MPLTTRPNTVCLPLRNGVAFSVMKNCDPLVPGPASGPHTASPFQIRSHGLLVVYQCTRTHSPHPPPWPGHQAPCQHNVSTFDVFSWGHGTPGGFQGDKPAEVDELERGRRARPEKRMRRVCMVTLAYYAQTVRTVCEAVPRVGHAEHAFTGMEEGEVLVGKLPAVDGLASRAVLLGEIAALSD